MDVVEKIYELLKEKKITAKILSENVGVSTGNMSDWKAGRSKPSITVLAKIAEYLEVSADYLLGLTDDPTPIDKKNASPTTEDALRILTNTMNLSEKDIEYLKETAKLLELKNKVQVSNEEISGELTPELS